MIEKCKALFFKYKEPILYIFFGGLTTVVNFLSYSALRYFFNIDYLICNIVGWFLSVTFAYVTNRKFVFDSKASGLWAVTKECSNFFFFRALSGVLDSLLMILSVDLLCMNEYLAKILVNVIVIIVNYVLSKLIIFRKPKNQ